MRRLTEWKGRGSVVWGAVAGGLSGGYCIPGQCSCTEMSYWICRPPTHCMAYYEVGGNVVSVMV